MFLLKPTGQGRHAMLHIPYVHTTGSKYAQTFYEFSISQFIFLIKGFHNWYTLALL
jgi:hypothetical protein